MMKHTYSNRFPFQGLLYALALILLAGANANAQDSDGEKTSWLHNEFETSLELEEPSAEWRDSLMSVPAVTQADTTRKYRVGLVLSGGGAKGIAHIGVIKALEDNNIPIDCVTGTSMGAIVGSLYSCGYSPERMMELIKSPVFQNCATGTLDPAMLYYYSKPQPTPAWASININFKGKSRKSITSQLIPSSLINPLPMNIEFLNLYAPFTSQCGEDFDHLMVPFRCVTSDVYHKHKIVLDRGSLGRAVRASMSFPLVFRPIEMDGVLVYDGGIYDNFPIDVMQEDFNPDFIIGVSVSSPDGKPKRNNVMSQLEDMIIQNNNYSVPAEDGVKIQCPVLNFGVLDFNQADVIYEIGYKTGLEMVDSIKKRTPARRDLSVVEQRRKNFAANTPNLAFDSVVVTAGTPDQKRFLTFLFNRGFKDRPFDMAQTQDAYYRAVSGGKLSNLVPEIEFGAVDSLNLLQRNNNVLILQPQIKSPWNIGVGGWLTTDTQSMLYLNFGYHTLSLNSLDIDLSGWVGQSYYAAMLAGKFTIHSRLPAYLKLETVVSRQKYYDSQLMFYQENTPTFITEDEAFLKLTYCLATGRKSLATASLAYGTRNDKFYPVSNVDYASTRRDLTKNHTAVVNIGWEYNTLGNVVFPMSGRNIKISFSGEWLHSKYFPEGIKKDVIDYKNHYRLGVFAKYLEYFRLHKNFRLGVSCEAMAMLGNLFRTYTAEVVSAHGFAPTPSVGNYFNPRFRSDNYVAVGLTPVWNPFEKFQIRGDFFGYLPMRNIERNQDGMAQYSGWFNKPAFIGELAAVYNFPFASLALYGNYMSSPAKNWNFGLSIGFYFKAPRLK